VLTKVQQSFNNRSTIV